MTEEKRAIIYLARKHASVHSNPGICGHCGKPNTNMSKESGVVHGKKYTLYLCPICDDMLYRED